MNFGTLKTRVQDVLGRTPNDVVYELVTSDVNNATRVRSLRKEVRRHETDEIMMPADWKSIVSVKRNNVELTPTAQSGVAFEDEGAPRRYAMTETTMLLSPRPGAAVFFEGTLTPGASGGQDGWQDQSRAPTGSVSGGSYGSVGVSPPDIIAIRTNVAFSTTGVIYALRDLGETIYLNFLPSAAQEFVFSRGSLTGGYYVYLIDSGAGTLKSYFETYVGQEINALVSSTSGLNVGQGDIEITYYEKLADLSADADTNDILSKYPQIYVYGSLFHHHSLTQNAEAAQGYYQLYERAMNEARKENNAALFGAGPVVPKVRSAP